MPTPSGKNVLDEMEKSYGTEKGEHFRINPRKSRGRKWAGPGGFTKGIRGQSSRARSKGKVR